MTSDPDDLGFVSPSAPGLVPAPGVEDLSLPEAAPAGGPPAGPPGRPARRPLTARARRRAWVAGGAVLATALVAVGLGLGVVAARDAAWAPVPADVAEPTEVNAVQLVLGSCVEGIGADGPVDRVRVVPCDTPHGAQVVGRTDAAPDAVWPGSDGAVRRASLGCGPGLLGPGGRAEADALQFVVWVPSEESWEAGDRAGLCLAASDTKHTGTLLDQGEKM